MKVNMNTSDYRVSAYFIGSIEDGRHTGREFFYVPMVRGVFVRNRVSYPVGNNRGDCVWQEFAMGTLSSSRYPFNAEAVLPKGTSITEEPREVLLEVSPGCGKAWII